MSTNVKSNIDWLGIVSDHAKNLDGYVQVDVDQQWSIFKSTVEEKKKRS